MSIKLDWEVESEGGWSEIGEDAAALAARRRHARQVRSIILGLLGIGLVIGGAIGFRLYTADQQARADLRSTVTAETAAIRIGDSDAYLEIQENVGSWRQMQSDRFSQYRAQSDRVKTEGEIVTLDMDGGKGRVMVRETVDGKAYDVVWFYQREESGWKHVPPEIAYWGWPHEFASPHYNISYWDEDVEFVRKLQDKLEGWWDQACRLTECHQGTVSAPALLKIKVEPDPLLQTGWASYDPKTLRIPSPLLGRVPADGSLDPELQRVLAGYIAQYWERELLEPAPDDTSDLAWVHDEFRGWLTSAFIPGAPPAPVLGPLSDTAGAPAVMALVERVKQNQDVVAALQDVTGKAAGDLPVVWDRYLTYRLRAEVALVDGNHSQEALLLYRDPERSSDDLLSGFFRNAAIETLDVTSTRQYGDLLWAEVHFTRTQAAGENGALTSSSWVARTPFRLVNARWTHTSPIAEDFGGPAVERGPHVSLHYDAIDVPTVDGVLPTLEQQYMTIAADLGVSEPPPIDIQISHSVSGSGFALSPPPGHPEESPDTISIWIGSPYGALYPDGQPLQTTLLNTLTRDMAAQVVAYQTRPLNSAHGLGSALARWEVRHLGLDLDGMAAAGVRPGANPPESMDALWASAQASTSSGMTALAADALIDMVVEKKGAEAIPALVQNLALSNSMQDWLSRSVGLDPLAIEPEWKFRVRAMMPARP